MLLKRPLVNSVALLLVACANNDGGERPVITAVTSEESPEINEQFALLLEACISGKAEYVRQLIKEEGASLVNMQTLATGDTPLQRATEFGHLEVVQILLTAGARPNLAGKDGNTPLMHASYRGFDEIAAVLLQNQANPNVSEERYGDTPLILAAWKGHLKVVELLVRAGARVNDKAKDGRTALSVANNSEHRAIVEFLRANGAT
jgi:ankyrin repeat protein